MHSYITTVENKQYQCATIREASAFGIIQLRVFVVNWISQHTDTHTHYVSRVEFKANQCDSIQL